MELLVLLFQVRRALIQGTAGMMSACCPLRWCFGESTFRGSQTQEPDALSPLRMDWLAPPAQQRLKSTKQND